MTYEAEEDIFIAPAVDLEFDEHQALDTLVEFFEDHYFRAALAAGPTDSSLPIEVAKSVGHWKASLLPLSSLTYLLREAIEDHDDASDLALVASSTIAACKSIDSLMAQTLRSAFYVHQQVNNHPALTELITERAEEMVKVTGQQLPDIQLELFESGTRSTDTSPDVRG